MTLQQPRSTSGQNVPLVGSRPILCHKCGAKIVFSKDHISPVTKRKVPLDPYFNNEPHVQHCMYRDLKWNRHTESLFTDFLSLVPSKRPKRIIGAVGRAK